MPVPAYKQTWRFATNTPLNPAAGVPQATAMLENTQRQLFMLKELLLCLRPVEGKSAHVGSPGAWSIYACSDGVSVATDGTDLWGTTFNAAKLVRGANASTARSWMIVWKQIGLRRAYLWLDFRSDANSRATFAFADMEPVNGGAFSTSENRGRVRANCVRGWAPVGVPEGNGGNEYMMLNANIATCPASYAHFGIGDDGSWYWATTETTAAAVRTLMGFSTWDVSLLSTEQSPGAFYCFNYGWAWNGNNHITFCTPGAQSGGSGGTIYFYPSAYVSSNAGGGTGVAYTGGVWCGRKEALVDPNLDAAYAAYAQRSHVIPGADVGWCYLNGSVSWPTAYVYPDNERPFLGMFVFTGGTANQTNHTSYVTRREWQGGLRGVLKDIYHAFPANHAIGAMSPASPPYTWCHFQGAILPCAEQIIAGW